MPKISVIVPVYKVEKYLNRCVDSILSQTFSDFELILVDDGSPDNCGKICDEYAAKDKRIVVIHKENGGLSSARNAGLDWVFVNSNSEYIAFVDSDDWVHEQYLEKLYYAIKSENADMSICNTIRLDEDNNELVIENDKYLKREVFSGELYEKSANNWRISVAWAKLYSKKIFVDLRYPVNRFYEDDFLIHHIFYRCKTIVVIDEILYYYFQRLNSITHTVIDFKHKEDICAIFKDKMEFFKSIDNDWFYKEYLCLYLNCFASNVKYLHYQTNNRKTYKKYRETFLNEFNLYKSELNNPYKIYINSIDRKKFDICEKFKYIYALLKIYGINLFIKKVFKKIFKLGR